MSIFVFRSPLSSFFFRISPSASFLFIFIFNAASLVLSRIKENEKLHSSDALLVFSECLACRVLDLVLSLALIYTLPLILREKVVDVSFAPVSFRAISSLIAEGQPLGANSFSRAVSHTMWH